MSSVNHREVLGTSLKSNEPFPRKDSKPTATSTTTNRYQNGKIYKIVNSTDEKDCYVGSTCLELYKRLYMHKHRPKVAMGRKLYQKMVEVGLEKFNIVPIEVYPCQNKTELRIREQFHLDQLKPNLNMYRAHSTEEQKKNSLVNYMATDKYKTGKTAWSARRVVCECGMTLNRSSLSNHKKRRIHNGNPCMAKITHTQIDGQTSSPPLPNV